ncbi:hypothetical protein HK100_008448, partial [Physocladia obscura]
LELYSKLTSWQKSNISTNAKNLRTASTYSQVIYAATLQIQLHRKIKSKITLIDLYCWVLEIRREKFSWKAGLLLFGIESS